MIGISYGVKAVQSAHVAQIHATDSAIEYMAVSGGFKAQNEMNSKMARICAYCASTHNRDECPNCGAPHSEDK